MSDSTLSSQYEAVFILANDGIDSFYEYIESNNIPFFLNDDEERYFQDQGRISANERKQFILKTSRLSQAGTTTSLDSNVSARTNEEDDDNKEDEEEEDNYSDSDNSFKDAADNRSSIDLDSPDAQLGLPHHMQQGVGVVNKGEGVGSFSHVYVLFQPPITDNMPHIQDVITSSIAWARTCIRISMYVFTDIFIYNALCNAASNRRVTVDILLDATQVDKFLGMLGKNYLSIPENVNICQNSGTGPYRRSTGATMGIAHEKFMICDENKAVFGSFNFTWSAANINRENVAVVNGEKHPIIQSLLREFNRLQESCILIET